MVLAFLLNLLPDPNREFDTIPVDEYLSVGALRFLRQDDIVVPRRWESGYKATAGQPL